MIILTANALNVGTCYCKENCRWVTRDVQNSNKRNNVFIEVDGVRLHMTEWARRLGVNHTAIIYRLKAGWSDRDAVTVPARAQRATLKQVNKRPSP